MAFCPLKDIQEGSPSSTLLDGAGELVRIERNYWRVRVAFLGGVLINIRNQSCSNSQRFSRTAVFSCSEDMVVSATGLILCSSSHRRRSLNDIGDRVKHEG